MARAAGAEAPGTAPPLTVIVNAAGGARREHTFTQTFRIGRGGECEVYVEGNQVSRTHAEVTLRDGRWWVRDLASTNGTFLDGVRVTEAAVPARAVLQLGGDGARLMVRIAVGDEVEGGATRAESPLPESYYVAHYLQGSKSSVAGRHTIMIRQAFRDVMRKRRRNYLLAIGGVAVLLAAVAALSLHQRSQLARQRRIAEEIFYQMKAVELHLAQLEQRVGKNVDPAVAGELSADRSKLAGLERSYDSFLTDLGVYSPKMTPEHRLILRVARVFGECELAMPEGLVTEVERYIAWWRSNTRLADAVARGRASGCAATVTRAMTARHLPPQFFYLALEESDFRGDLCGPQTRYGIPKGPWQFVPETAIAYGLRTGPLYLLPIADPRDERFDFAKATGAAADYLRDMYTTEAQASGLLVVASYNWGEGNVRVLIRSMPEDPRKRNMWRLIEEHRKQIPRETFAYVFRVFSAAVIGEDPHLFGFAFGNPLEPGPSSR